MKASSTHFAEPRDSVEMPLPRKISLSEFVAPLITANMEKLNARVGKARSPYMEAVPLICRESATEPTR